MFGILDLIYSYVLEYKDGKNVKLNGKPAVKIDRKSDETWFCFLPVSAFRPIMNGSLFPKKGNVVAYLVPRIIPNPAKSYMRISRVYNDALKRAKSHAISGKKINILGVSLGNVIAYRLATKVKAKELISIVPGSKLPECIWDGIATRKSTRTSGFKFEDFNKCLSSFNPIDNVNKINSRIEIHLGGYDKVVPYKRGLELLNKLKAKKKNFILRLHPNLGHCAVIFKFAYELSRRS